MHEMGLKEFFAIVNRVLYTLSFQLLLILEALLMGIDRSIVASWSRYTRIVHVHWLKLRL